MTKGTVQLGPLVPQFIDSKDPTRNTATCNTAIAGPNNMGIEVSYPC